MANRTIYISADGNTSEARSLEDVHGSPYPIKIGPESVVHTKLTQLGQVPEDKQTQFALFLGADGVIKKRRLDDQLFTGKKFVTEDKWIVLTNTDNNIDINPWHQQRPYKKNTWEFKLSDKLRVKDLYVAGELTGPNISNGDSTTVIIENPYTWNLSINGSSQAVPNLGTVNVYDGSAITIDQSGLGFVVNHADTSNYEASSYSGPWIISRIDTDTYGHVQEVTPRQLTINDLGGPYDNYVKWQVQDISSTSYAVTSGGTLLVRGFGSTTVFVDPTSGAIDISSVGGSGAPGGANTNVQYNNFGAFGGNAGLTYNKSLTSPVLTVNGTNGAFLRLDAGLSESSIAFLDTGAQKAVFGYSNLTEKITISSNLSLSTPISLDMNAPANSLDVDSFGNVVSAQDIRGATLRTTDVISAESLATNANGDIIPGSVYNWTASDDVTSIDVTSLSTVKWVGAGSTTVSLNPSTNTFEISSVGGSATPGGANTNIQYNDSGAFGGNSALTFNKSATSPVLTVNGTNGANVRIDANAGSAGIQYFKSGVQKFGFNYNTTTDVFVMQSNVSFSNPVTINAAAPVNSLDIDSAGNITSAQDIRGATLRTTDVISAASLATDINGNIIAGTGGSFVDTSTTLELRGTSLEIEVTPTGPQDLSTDRLWQIGLPDDVTITSDLTVGDTISLPNTTGATSGVFSIGGIDFHNYTTNGNKSIFIGDGAGNFTTVTGANNIAIGQNAQPNLISAYQNIGIGEGVLASNNSGNNNIAIGTDVLTQIPGTTGAIGIGFQALKDAVSTGGAIAIGYGANNQSTQSFFSVAIGQNALPQDNSSGNIAIGVNAGTESGLIGASEFLNGSNNTFLGANTKYDASAISNSTAIGAGATLSASNTIVLGTNVQSVAVGKSTAGNKLDVNGGIRAILPTTTSTPQLVGFNASNDLEAIDPSAVAVGPIHYNSTATIEGSSSNPTVTFTARQLNLSKSGRNVIGNIVLDIATYSGGSGDALIDFGAVNSEFSIWADPAVPRQPLGNGFIYNASGGVAYEVQACRRSNDQIELAYISSGSRALIQVNQLVANTEIYLTLMYASN